MFSNKQKIFTTKALIHLGAILPLACAYYLAIYGVNVADPVEYIIHFTGLGALKVLLLTLLVSPSAKYFKLPWLMQVRRVIGLYAFLYALLHIVNFWLFELNFNLSLFISELIERPYIWLGMVAFTLLLALAITSPNRIRVKMGRRWQKLHNSIYLILILVWVHYYWSVKATPLEPIIYLGLGVFVLSFRFNKLKKLFSNRSRS